MTADEIVSGLRAMATKRLLPVHLSPLHSNSVPARPRGVLVKQFFGHSPLQESRDVRSQH